MPMDMQKNVSVQVDSDFALLLPSGVYEIKKMEPRSKIRTIILFCLFLAIAGIIGFGYFCQDQTSNFLFVLLPPLLIYLFKEYGRFVTPGIHVLWVLLIIVGLSSMYFHATLSLIGQLLDELAILWVFMAAYSLFFPKKYYPQVFRNDRKLFSSFMFLSAIFATVMSIWKPIVNAFVLMGMGVPTMLMMYRELQRVRDQRVYRLGLRCTAVWLVAVFCWINDRMFCDAWSAINFPYLHGFWHVFIFIAAYTVLVLYAYFYVETELPQRQPLLKYWPKNDFEFGIPFICIRNPGMTIKSAI